MVSDWSNVNTIEVIGAGGGGGDTPTGSGAGGGGGGAYAWLANLTGLTIGNTVTYQVGSTTVGVTDTNGKKGVTLF